MSLFVTCLIGERAGSGQLQAFDRLPDNLLFAYAPALLVVDFGYVTDLSLWNKVKQANKSSERAQRE